MASVPRGLVGLGAVEIRFGYAIICTRIGVLVKIIWIITMTNDLLETTNHGVNSISQRSGTPKLFSFLAPFDGLFGALPRTDLFPRTFAAAGRG
jgi:hypothetical protein